MNLFNVGTMRKYHVAVEASSSESIMSMMGGGFAIKYFTVGMDDGEPVNAETLYEVINRDREHKTGAVIAWSRIEENGD